MKQLPLLAALACIAAVQAPGDDASIEPRSWRQAARELRALTEDGEHDRALAVAARIADSTDWSEATEPERAEAWYAAGVAQGRAGASEVAVASFRRAWTLAGPGELRLDAMYDAGAWRLDEAERLRLEIPEIAGGAAGAAGLAVPGGPGAPPMPGATPEEGPDPLVLAQAAYELARGSHVERLRADWRDEDTRANLEWIQRRLEELEEIRRKREEQQEEQQDQQQQDQQQDQQDQQDQQQDDQQQEDPQQQDQDPQDPQDPNESEAEDQEQEQEQEPAEPEEPEEDEGGEGSEEEPEDEGAEPQPAEPQELVLTEEEVQRLLDQLRELEEEAEAVRAALTQRQRVPVKEDW